LTYSVPGFGNSNEVIICIKPHGDYSIENHSCLCADVESDNHFSLEEDDSCMDIPISSLASLCRYKPIKYDFLDNTAFIADYTYFFATLSKIVQLNQLPLPPPAYNWCSFVLYMLKTVVILS